MSNFRLTHWSWTFKEGHFCFINNGSVIFLLSLLFLKLLPIILLVIFFLIEWLYKTNSQRKPPKRSAAKTPKNPSKPAESTKINKKPLFLKNCNFIQNENQLRDLFYEINPNIKFSKTTLYSSRNIKLLPKATKDY